jgi:ribosomal protein L15
MWLQELRATVSNVESIIWCGECVYCVVIVLIDTLILTARPIVVVDSLLKKKVITKSKIGIHKVVMGKEEFTAKDITVQAHAFTQSAREAIEKNGGKCEVLKRTTGEVIAA